MFKLQKSHPNCFCKDVSVWRKSPCAGSAHWLFNSADRVMFKERAAGTRQREQLPLRSTRISQISLCVRGRSGSSLCLQLLCVRVVFVAKENNFKLMNVTEDQHCVFNLFTFCSLSTDCKCNYVFVAETVIKLCFKRLCNWLCCCVIRECFHSDSWLLSWLFSLVHLVLLGFQYESFVHKKSG